MVSVYVPPAFEMLVQNVVDFVFVAEIGMEDGVNRVAA